MRKNAVLMKTEEYTFFCIHSSRSTVDRIKRRVGPWTIAVLGSPISIIIFFYKYIGDQKSSYLPPCLVIWV